MSSELQKLGGDTAMELQKEPRKSRFGKITLEHYIDFLDSEKQSVLPVNFLRQMLPMHGFKCIQGARKEDIMEAVRSIDLMEPARSTINGDNISSCAFIKLQDAINDLSILKWQECCITSIQTYNSINYNQLTTTTTTTTTTTVASTCSKKSKSKPSSNKSSLLSAAASVVTDHSAQTPLEQLEMEPRSGEVESDISSAIVVHPNPDDGCGTQNQPRTNKRKRFTSLKMLN